MSCQNLTATHEPHPVAPGEALTITATGTCPAATGVDYARFSLRIIDPAGNRAFDFEPSQGLDQGGISWQVPIGADVMRGLWAYVVTLGDDRTDERVNVQGGFEVAG